MMKLRDDLFYDDEKIGDYPQDISAEDVEKLESLRREATKRLGNNMTCGQFIVWMYHTIISTNQSVSGSCEEVSSEIDDIIERLISAKRRINRMKKERRI